MATGDIYGNVKIWDVANNFAFITKFTYLTNGLGYKINSVSYSRDGN